MSLKSEWDKVLELSSEEQIEQDGLILAFQFLSRIDKARMDQGLSKKELAIKVGTSASFITQLFSGDRKPSWNMLAKMQKELSIEFEIHTGEEIQDFLEDEIMDYHKKWSNTLVYHINKSQAENFDHVFSVVDKDYALAG